MRVFVLCNPDNPTGVVFQEADLMRFCAYLRRREVLIVSDEVYGMHMLDDASKFFSLRDY